MNRLVQLAQFLTLGRNTSLLLVALVLAGTGEKLWLGFASKYLEGLGAGVWIIGLFDALQTWLGAVYAYPGGWITDQWGQRRSLLLFSALSLAGYVLVLVWHHWLALVLGAFLFLAWSAFSLPTTLSVVATSLERHRHTMGIGVQSLVRRVPMMLGPLAGGWLITRYGWHQGMNYALLGCIALSGLTVGFQWFIMEPNKVLSAEASSSPQPPPSAFAKAMADKKEGREDAPAAIQRNEPGKTHGVPNFFGVVSSFTPAMRELLVSDILIRFCERIPFAFIVLWAMDHVGVSAQRYGLLVTAEMVTAMLCYIPVAHLADKYGRRPFVLVTFGFFTLFPVSLLWADSFAWLTLAFVIRGLKEFGEPARKALIIAEARPELRARTYGAYYLIRDCIVSSGSFLGAWLWRMGPHANFIGAAVCGALGTVWFWRFVYGRREVGPP